MARKRNTTRDTEITKATGKNAPHPIAGVYEGEYSSIELQPDFYTTDGWLILVNGVPSSHIVLGEPQALVFEYMRWIATGTRAFTDEFLDTDKLRITQP